MQMFYWLVRMHQKAFFDASYLLSYLIEDRSATEPSVAMGSCPLVISTPAMLRSNRQTQHNCCSEAQSSSGSSALRGNLAASGTDDRRLAFLALPIREKAFSQKDLCHVRLSELIHGHRSRGRIWD